MFYCSGQIKQRIVFLLIALFAAGGFYYVNVVHYKFQRCEIVPPFTPFVLEDPMQNNEQKLLFRAGIRSRTYAHYVCGSNTIENNQKCQDILTSTRLTDYYCYTKDEMTMLVTRKELFTILLTFGTPLLFLSVFIGVVLCFRGKYRKNSDD